MNSKGKGDNDPSRSTATKQLQRACAIPYNHFLHGDIRALQNKLGLNKLTFDECDKWLLALSDYWGSHKPKEKIVSLVPIETKNEIEKAIYYILARYQLPMSQFWNIALCLFENDPCFDLPTDLPTVRKSHFDPVMGRTDIIVEELEVWTTKQQWEALWDTQVMPLIKKLRDSQGIGMIPKKIMVPSVIKQMDRWAEWYFLSEREGLGPAKALEKWEKTHQDEGKTFDHSTVIHAIQEFRRIITPLPESEAETISSRMVTEFLEE